MSNSKIFLFEKNLEILWGDMDALGHVNNARYFSYLEQLRISWMHSIGATKQQQNNSVGAVIARTEADYLRPIVFPATLTLRLYADQPGNTSMKTYNEIWDANDSNVCYLRAMTVLVWFDFEKDKTHSVPDNIRALFN